jgi:hypothetical protein
MSMWEIKREKKEPPKKTEAKCNCETKEPPKKKNQKTKEKGNKSQRKRNTAKKMRKEKPKNKWRVEINGKKTYMSRG